MGDHPVIATDGRRRRERGQSHAAARERDDAPHDGEHEDPDADPHGSRHRVATDVAADASPEPQQADDAGRDAASPDPPASRSR